MTKFHMSILAVTTALAQTPAFAQSADVNEDGVLTIGEVQAVFPEITGATFSAMDLNADGALDGDEVAAAQEAGLIPAS